MKKILLATAIGVILLLSGIQAVALKTNVTTSNNTNKGTRSFTHNVFAEDATATWCSHCPYAHESLNRLYKIGQYPFFYTSLVADKNTHAASRTNDYNLYGYPTVFFDGGYQVDVGSYDNWQQQMNWYNQSLIQCGARTVPDIVTFLNVDWLGNATMNIQVSVYNNDTTPYAGHIRVYVTEVESSMGWIDTQGHKYTFPFLDYAFNENISVAAGNTWTNSTIWDGHNYNDGYGHDFGSIQYGNIMVEAAVFNASWVLKYSYPGPPQSNPFHAYYVDDSTGFLVAGNGPNPPSNPDPKNGATSVDINKTLSWTGGGSPGTTITYDVYFGTTNPPSLVVHNQSASTYNPGTMNYQTTYYWKIVAWDQNHNTSQGPLWHFTTITYPNHPPTAPTITGPAKGKLNTMYKFTFTTTDPDPTDLVYVLVDWGDNTTTDWVGPHNSGAMFIISHSWTTKGTFTVKAKAEDNHGAESDWSTLQVKMPATYGNTYPLLHWLIEHFPNAFPLLRYLFGE